MCSSCIEYTSPHGHTTFEYELCTHVSISFNSELGIYCMPRADKIVFLVRVIYLLFITCDRVAMLQLEIC
jgi:hypothetical protein